MGQIYNPYLPLTEYVPDGEPHVFGERVYIYGSHDKAGGTAYCEGDCVTYSAAACICIMDLPLPVKKRCCFRSFQRRN